MSRKRHREPFSLDQLDLTPYYPPNLSIPLPLLLCHRPREFVPGQRVYTLLLHETVHFNLQSGNQCPPMRRREGTKLESREKWLRRLKKWFSNHKNLITPKDKLYQGTQCPWQVLYDDDVATCTQEQTPFIQDLIADGWPFASHPQFTLQWFDTFLPDAEPTGHRMTSQASSALHKQALRRDKTI